LPRRLTNVVTKLIVLLAVACGAAQFLMANARAEADSDHLREYLIKAGFLYNFPKFTEWPEAAFLGESTTLEVCVLGEDPFGAALESIEGKPIGQKSVHTRRAAELRDTVGCHVVFVSASERAQLATILTALDASPVLTVSDVPEFSQAGGMITLQTVNNQIRFQINLIAAERARLRFSSKMLMLAEIVTSAPGGGQ
jgi:hypothetical protein